MKILSIIPARGGSKGIPGKNIKLLGGKPLIAYSIKQSLVASHVTKTVVSTEDSDIASVSKRFGAEIIIRPSELATDECPLEPTITHALQVLEKKDFIPDIIVLLQCTTPLRRKGDINEAINLILSDKYDSVVSAFPSKFSIWRIEDDQPISLNYNFKNRQNRQDRPREYVENGSIYVFTKKLFDKKKNRLGGRIGVYEMPYLNSIEIDNPFDFWLCEQALKYLKKSS